VIRVLVVDDHPVVREGLISVLEDQPDLQIIGAAGSAEEALSLVRRLRPDVVLLDLELPGMGGLAAIPYLLAGSAPPRVLVFTAYDTDDRVRGALEAGAAGYLLKGVSGEEIARSVRSVYEGKTALEPRIAARTLPQTRSPARQRGPLTPREREVLELVAQGLANKEIASRLGISERTVKFHIASIMDKLGAENRAQATALALQRGLLR